MDASQRVSTLRFAAPRYTPADFAEPDRRPRLVRWTSRAGEVTAEVVRTHVARKGRQGKRGPTGPHR